MGRVARTVHRGTTLDARFRLEEMIGSGAMGSVYSALDLEQGHRVAVKLLSRRLDHAGEQRERFLEETHHAASIPHPHILTVYAHGEDDGWSYFAMRLVEDEIGALVQRDGPLDLTRALNIAGQIAWALDVAHERGLVHRDVKPENILLTPRRSPDEPDHAYLADFGIAKLVDADRALTRTGAFVGTVSYASPEQARGERLDGRSDQYSLACVLFEMLTGDPPFRGDSSEAVLVAHREAVRPRVSEACPGLPAVLDAVLAQGMSVQPEGRFGRCREMVVAARRAARGEPAPHVTPPAVPAPTVVPGEPNLEPEPETPRSEAIPGSAVAPERHVAPGPDAEPVPTPEPEPEAAGPQTAPAPARRPRRRRRTVALLAGPAALVGAGVAVAILGGDVNGGGRVLAASDIRVGGTPLRLEIADLARDDETVSLTMRLAHTGSGDSTTIGTILDDGVTEGRNAHDTADGIRLRDEASGRSYAVARRADGRCRCEAGLARRSVTGGESTTLVAIFAAPPDDVDALDVEVPQFGTFKQIPLS